MFRLVAFYAFLMIYLLNILNLQSLSKNSSPNNNYVQVNSYFDNYSNDLSAVEKFLFGKTYKNNNIIIRIARIEAKLYGRSMSAMSISDRMNNIINDYRNDYYQANNNAYCAPQKGVLQKLKDTFIGVPVGYTPQIEPSPYINTYGPSYMQGFYGSNGWRDHNIYNPSYAASKFHLLD